MKYWIIAILLFIAVPGLAVCLWHYPLLLYGLNIGSVVVSFILLKYAVKWDLPLKYLPTYGYFLGWLFAVLLSYLANKEVHHIHFVIFSIQTGMDETLIWLISLGACLVVAFANYIMYENLKYKYVIHNQRLREHLENLKR